MRHILMAVLVLLFPTAACADLAPDEVAVLGMAQSDASCELAEYYAEARGIPKSQILLLESKPGGRMPRATWQEEVRPAIRAWLAENGLEAKIRCFVTTWDVPLRIGPRLADAPVVVARQEFLRRARADLSQQVAELIKTLDELQADAQPPERPAFDVTTELDVLTAQFESAFQAAGRRAQKVESADEKKRGAAVLERAFLSGGGIAALLRTLARQAAAAEPDSKVARQVEAFRGRLQGLSEGLQVLGNLSDSIARDEQSLNLVRISGGLVGALRWIDQQQQLLKRSQTQASFDSELSLLLRADYPLSRWRPNALYCGYARPPVEHWTTLMVSRLEAPSIELAKGLIDTAIATEKTGLTGKVYIDARGIEFDPKSDKRGSYGEFDQSLRDLAERLKAHTQLEVVLDNEAKLFQPGQCPEAALYCGWYSLAKYIDAFDWKPGAIGCHLASSEASTLRKPGGKVWCNAMLEDGICATLGPAFEPYLTSFPLPDDFFSLLLTGRYTLAEVYYRTKPYNSWAMVLVGDPLYNPFKTNPPLSEDALPDRLKARSTQPVP